MRRRLICLVHVVLGCGAAAVLSAQPTQPLQDNENVSLPQLLQNACDDGDAGGCGMLGMLYATGEGLPRDAAKATEHYRKACDGGYLGSCLSLGVRYEKGEGVPQDRGRAAALYRKACDGGALAGCHNLGVMYDTGEGVVQDKAKAAGLYRKACDGGVAHGCFNLAVKYERGEGLLMSGAASADTYHQAGLLHLKQYDRSNALLCVERIRKLTDIQKLTVPNAFLADRLLDEIYGKGEGGSGKGRTAK
jgi:uncharacterized protein